MAEGVNGLVAVYMLLIGAVPSYTALGVFAWRIQNQTNAAIAPSTATPPTVPPTIAPVLEFEGEAEEVGVGEDVPVVAPDVIETGSVVNATSVEVDCSLVAVDSGASKNS